MRLKIKNEEKLKFQKHEKYQVLTNTWSFDEYGCIYEKEISEFDVKHSKRVCVVKLKKIFLNFC
jgi:hypothetical protein